MSRTTTLSLVIVAVIGCLVFLLPRLSARRASRAAESSAVQEEPSGPRIAAAGNTPSEDSRPADLPTAVRNEFPADTSLDARTLIACRSSLVQRRNVGRLNCDSVKPEDAAGQRLCRDQLAAMTKRLEDVATNAASCPANLLEPSEYYKSLRVVALSGDVTAQRCFIQGRFNDADRNEQITSEEVKDYVVLTRTLIDAGFQRGDWSLVRWLGRIKLEFGDGLLGQAYPIGQSHPETIYRMKFLLTLGGHAKTDTEDAQRIVELWQRNKMLSDEQRREAEDWARTMYAQHFVGSQEGASTPVHEFCDMK